MVLSEIISEGGRTVIFRGLLFAGLGVCWSGFACFPCNSYGQATPVPLATPPTQAAPEATGAPGTTGAETVQAARTPKEVLNLLLATYGRDLKSNSYIPAMAMMARLQQAQRANDDDDRQAILRILAPYRDGSKPTTTKSNPELAGHLLFAETARLLPEPERQKDLTLVVTAAKTLFANGELDRPKPPDAEEMSDAVFMCAPLLCEAGALTGDDRYTSAAISYVRVMRTQCLRPDGIYRHWPKCEAAWGRGNGFPAIGVARSLQRLPVDHPGRGELLAAFQEHMRALLRHQDPSGSWHQVIDRPDSYQEFSCTAMIGWSLQLGINMGWLDAAEFQPAADRAWAYIERSIGMHGELTAVCESTGKQPTVDAYLQRKAINGMDERGGAMALHFALLRDQR